LTVHASPFCPQNEPVAQTPLVQSLEQHSPCAEHGLPKVRHTGFSGVQVLPLHVPLQHCAEVVHAWLSAVHCDPLHVPLSQTSVQQSVGLAHMAPLGRQVPEPSAPPVPPVLESMDPPSNPPAPPVEMPSTSPPPHPALQAIPRRTAVAVFVSKFLTSPSFEIRSSLAPISVAAFRKRLTGEKRESHPQL